MKITDNSPNKAIPFKNVPKGDVFRSTSGECFIKTESVLVEEVYQYDGFYEDVIVHTRNAVNLSSGQLVKFDQDYKVIHVDCELVIN